MSFIDKQPEPKSISPGADNLDPAALAIRRRQAKREVALIFGIAIFLCAIFWQLRLVAPFFRDNLHALIAAVFLYLPTGLILKRHEAFEDYGLTIHPVKRSVKLFLLASLVVFPLFGLGFFLYYRTICAQLAAGMWLPRGLQSMCRRFIGAQATPRWAALSNAKEMLQLVAAQILVVALPEEYFFRGYVQSRLEVAWPSQRRFLGAPVGASLFWSSAMFAVGHLLVDFNGLRLAVFFPALVFGWLRQSSGSIFAGVLFHAASNLVSELLHRAYFLR